jgi:MFS superfamily sulfate permease-like transporter
MDGIAVAVVLSLLDQVRHTYRPRTAIEVRAANGRWESVPLQPVRFAATGIVVYRFAGNLFYANASHFMEEVLELVTDTAAPVRGLVLDASGIDDVDFSAAKMLLQLRAELAKREVDTTIANASDALLPALRRYGLGDRDGAGIFPSLDAAVAALDARMHAAAAPPANEIPAPLQ